MNKVKVGAVSYFNTKPLIYGFQQGMMQDSVELVTDYPSRIATMLLNNEIDVGLVPVAIIPGLQTPFIISDYCIGSDGPVASVGLFSDEPIEEIKEVLLDYQSRTSVKLARILLREYWKRDVIITDAKEDFREQIKGNVAGVVIGDRAFEQRKVSKYMYDFGEAWNALTGLPFVYAAWVSNKALDKSFIQSFNEATSFGIQHLDKVLEENPYGLFDLSAYFTKHMSYKLDDPKRKGLQLFLQKIAGYGL
jgi:chorismate dehydratase